MTNDNNRESRYRVIIETKNIHRTAALSRRRRDPRTAEIRLTRTFDSPPTPLAVSDPPSSSHETTDSPARHPTTTCDRRPPRRPDRSSFEISPHAHARSSVVHVFFFSSDPFPRYHPSAVVVSTVYALMTCVFICLSTFIVRISITIFI